MSDIWGENPPDLDELDKSLNGIPSKLAANNNIQSRYQTRQVALNSPAQDQSTIQPGSFTEKLAAINKGLYGSLPFGIGDWILNKTEPGQYQEMKKAAAANPGLETAGSIGGSLGQAIEAPALGAGKFAVQGVKGLGSLIGRNALNAAVASAPPAITQAAGGDIGGAAKSFALGTGAGTVLGTATEGVANKLPELLSTFKNWAQRRGLGAAGVATRDLRKALSSGPLGKYAGTTINNADDEVSNLWNTLKQTGAFGKKTQEQLFGDKGEVWQQLANGFNSNKVKLTDPTYSQGIMSDPRIQALIGRSDIGTPEDMQALIQNTIGGIDSGADYNAKKKIADEIIKRGFSPTVTGPAQAQGVIAKIVKDNIDDIAGTFTPQIDIAGAKQDWHTIQPLVYALKREEAVIPKAEAGSATQPRQVLGHILTGSGEGAGFGVFGEALTSSPDDPDRWKKILTGGLAGTVLGGAANRLLAKGINRVGGEGIARLSDLITPGAIAGFSKAGSAIGPKVAPAIGRLMGQAGLQASNPQDPTSQITNEALSSGSDPVTNQTAAAVTQSAQALPAPAQDAAKQQTNTLWSLQIKDRLGAIYDSMVAPQFGDLMSRDEFFNQAQQLTNNFDPHLTAGFIFKDRNQALAYLKYYDTALKIQGANLDQALQEGGNVGFNPLERPGLAATLNPFISGVGRKPQTEQSAMALENLKSIIVQLATPYGGKPDAATVNQVSKVIDGIAARRTTPQMKRKALRDVLQEYGMDYDLLTKYGAVPDIVGGQSNPKTPQIASR